jgi:hypothetical protein
MLSIWRSSIALGLFVIAANTYIGAQNSVYISATNEQKATVGVLAISSSVHTGAGGNQEIYLADVTVKGSSHQLAKLVDVYPSIDFPIQRSLLAERHPLQMTLIRDSQCNTTGQKFFLRSDDANIFDASTRRTLHDNATETIPCFRVLHNATRLAKQ